MKVQKRFGGQRWFLLIYRNGCSIDNISNKLIIKRFPVEVIIFFSEMGLCQLYHLADQELFGDKLMGMVLSGASTKDLIGAPGGVACGAMMCSSFLIPDDIAKSLNPVPLYKTAQGQMICLKSTYHVSNRGNKELHCFALSLRPQLMLHMKDWNLYLCDSSHT